MIKSKSLLLLMRHGKSDWQPLGLDDFHRPLNQKGPKQSLAIAQELNNLGINIDYALVSPALRTRQTFDLLREHLNYDLASSFDLRLYNAGLSDLLEVLKDQINLCQVILVVAHNPGLSHLLNFLSAKNHLFSTAELAILSPTQKTAMSFYEHSFNCKRIIRSE